MAKSQDEKVNKSAAVRDALAQDPKAKARDIVATLGAKGIKVQPSLVYLIISKQRRQVRRAKREQVQEVSRQTGSNNPVQLVLKVRALADEAGGIKNLKMLVDAFIG